MLPKKIQVGVFNILKGFLFQKATAKLTKSAKEEIEKYLSTIYIDHSVKVKAIGNTLRCDIKVNGKKHTLALFPVAI